MRKRYCHFFRASDLRRGHLDCVHFFIPERLEQIMDGKLTLKPYLGRYYQVRFITKDLKLKGLVKLSYMHHIVDAFVSKCNPGTKDLSLHYCLRRKIHCPWKFSLRFYYQSKQSSEIGLEVEPSTSNNSQIKA